MVRIKYSRICLLATLTIFTIVSKIIFDKVFETSNLVVDEAFHYSLGEAYCNYEFAKWNPKVTTFPGLYLLSSLLLGWLNLCTAYHLRLVSLLFAVINIVLFYCYLSSNNRDPAWKNVLTSTNLALLPPLYFFSHFYYTDVTSLSMVLLMLNAYQAENHYLASIFGLCAVLFRQTNIIWVGMVAALYILKQVNATGQGKRTFEVSQKELLQLLNIPNGFLFRSIPKLTLKFWLNTASYLSLLICFVLFVLFNGSIVVGDKSAHEATINIPQLFYFSLFSLFFAWPHFVPEIRNFFNFIRLNPLKFGALTILCLVIVHFNTLVHPYMLADNRHYVFYIWNRFYGKYYLFRYCVVPLYMFAFYVIVKKLYNNRRDASFPLIFIPCSIVLLITQRLLEFRYFFIPYVLFRMQIKNASNYALVCEFLSHVIINSLTFYVFFTKTIEWPDFNYPQRLIW